MWPHLPPQLQLIDFLQKRKIPPTAPASTALRCATSTRPAGRVATTLLPREKVQNHLPPKPPTPASKDSKKKRGKTQDTQAHSVPPPKSKAPHPTSTNVRSPTNTAVPPPPPTPSCWKPRPSLQQHRKEKGRQQVKWIQMAGMSSLHMRAASNNPANIHAKLIAISLNPSAKSSHFAGYFVLTSWRRAKVFCGKSNCQWLLMTWLSTMSNFFFNLKSIHVPMSMIGQCQVNNKSLSSQCQENGSKMEGTWGKKEGKRKKTQGTWKKIIILFLYSSILLFYYFFYPTMLWLWDFFRISEVSSINFLRLLRRKKSQHHINHTALPQEPLEIIRESACVYSGLETLECI